MIGPQFRGILRLSSALTLLCFVICHLVNHSLVLVSIRLAQQAHDYLIGPWRSKPGSVLLLTAALAHYGNALWSIYVRRSLKMPLWQLCQLALGLTIPFLWIAHFVDTRLAEDFFRVTPDYNYVLVLQWVVAPWKALLQGSMLLTVWTHAAVGINFWLRPKAWYPVWRPWLLGVAVMLPSLALAGYVSAGNQVLRLSKDPSFAQDVLDDANLPAEKTVALDRLAAIGWSLHLALLLAPFAGRGLRRLVYRAHQRPSLLLSSGRRIPVQPGATMLETLRDHGIAHASVCGGRGRCTTCRVRVQSGQDRLPVPGSLEAKALSSFNAAANVRLACQVRPTADAAIVALLPPDSRAALGAMARAMDGVEMLVTVVFLDLRGSTRIGEARLPFDVLFILNQFFHEMTEALKATNGHYSNFTGDGLMALYGLASTDAKRGAIDALRGAQTMLTRLDQLNGRLAGELREPLSVGIGIHSGTAIVGSMGPPAAQSIQALGDTVNTTARLESLTKEHHCPLILSRLTADLAGLAMDGAALQRAMVKGKDQPVEFYALRTVPAATAG